jgi:hypothetical protein
MFLLRSLLWFWWVYLCVLFFFLSYSLEYSFSSLCICCFSDNMSWVVLFWSGLFCGDCECLWLAAWLGRPWGVAQQRGDGAGLCRPEWHGWTEWISCRPVQVWGSQPSGTEIVGVWIISVAGHGGLAQKSRDHAGLCRPEGMAWLRLWMSMDPWLGRP